MKKVTLPIIALLSFVATYSQQTDSLDKGIIKEALFSSSHFSFSVMPFIPPAVTITNSSNQYIYKPLVFIGFEVGIHYRVNLPGSYVFVTGLNGGTNNRNFRFAITKDKFIPSLQRDMDLNNGAENKKTDYFVSIPLLIEKLWKTRRSNHWNAFAGINARYYWIKATSYEAWGTGDATGYAVLFLEQDLVKYNNNKLLFSINTGAGYSLLLKNYNFLRFNLIVNLSPAKLIKYNYKVPITGQEPLTGTYTLNTSYVGVGVEYIFTGTKKKIKQMLE